MPTALSTGCFRLRSNSTEFGTTFQLLTASSVFWDIHPRVREAASSSAAYAHFYYYYYTRRHLQTTAIFTAGRTSNVTDHTLSFGAKNTLLHRYKRYTETCSFCLYRLTQWVLPTLWYVSLETRDVALHEIVTVNTAGLRSIFLRPS